MIDFLPDNLLFMVCWQHCAAVQHASRLNSSQVKANASQGKHSFSILQTTLESRTQHTHQAEHNIRSSVDFSVYVYLAPVSPSGLGSEPPRYVAESYKVLIPRTKVKWNKILPNEDGQTKTRRDDKADIKMVAT